MIGIHRQHTDYKSLEVCIYIPEKSFVRLICHVIYGIITFMDCMKDYFRLHSAYRPAT